ncbi:MAG: Ig-like domain-containing protein [Planctomycetota bacterium]
MHVNRSACGILATSLLALAACEGGSAGDKDNRGDFTVALISTGQGQVYPYRIQAVDSRSNPTDTILNIESDETLRTNAVPGNGVLPVAAFPERAELPNGLPGNQFVQFRFTHKLGIDSILSDSLANASTNSGLTTAISLLAYDPNTERTTVLQGRGFVGGYTFFNRGGRLALIEAVRADDEGVVEILDPEAEGFPKGFSNDAELVSPKSFVFVADTDGDLATFETFDPLGQDLLIRMLVTNAVQNSDGRILEQEVCTATTVGSDPNPPEVLGYQTEPRIVPGNGQSGVDPQTSIRVSFNKPVQPSDVGAFLSATNRTPQPGGIALNVTVASASFGITYYADPVSYGDFCNYIVTPAYNLPGSTSVEVAVNASSIHGLNGPELGTNVTTTFTTGEGPGIVNAPVAPDAIYVGIGGAQPGVSVIDLNGYGQGTNGLEPDPITGQPTKPTSQTNFARNPNIGQPGVVPSLSVGTSTLDAGSNGPLTLVEDTRGNTRLLRDPLVGQISDIHIGAPLDLVYNNSNVNVNAGGQNQVNPVTQATMPGNCITVPPHPNPPKLVFPPPNLSRSIFGEEPTMTSSAGPAGFVITTVPPCFTSPINQLVSGTVRDYAPHFVAGVFHGPQPPPVSPPPPPPFCPFTARQQVGHFLYVLDRENRQVLVVNSNRFTILDTVRLSDPVSMTMSPSLGVLAVANFSSATISFVNIDPRSPAFNTVIAETRVDQGPSKVVWQPDGEAVIALSRQSNSLTVLSGADFAVQTTVTGGLNSPLDIAVTPRYVQTGNQSGVYYGYILNSNGTISVYESGPSGVNGIGFNDMVGSVDPTFRRATRVRLDYNSGLGGVFVTHTDESGVGQVSRVELTSSPTGQQPTQQNSGGFILPPTFRQKTWSITQRFGGSDPNVPGNQRLSGNSPIDVCTDEMFNGGAGTNQVTPYNNNLGVSIIQHSAKGALVVGGNVATGTAPFNPKYLFVALGDVGSVDVFDLATRVKVRTIPIPGVTSLTGYWKQ